MLRGVCLNNGPILIKLNTNQLSPPLRSSSALPPDLDMELVWGCRLFPEQDSVLLARLRCSSIGLI